MYLIWPTTSLEEFETKSTAAHVYTKIANVAKTCYQSGYYLETNPEDVKKATEMVKRLVKSNHWAMIEHGGVFTAKVITDRAIANEIVRHRLASYAQESTRYVKMGAYGKKQEDISFVIPSWSSLVSGKYYFNEDREIVFKHPSFPETLLRNFVSSDEFEKNERLVSTLLEAEKGYNDLIKLGATPQEARALLPLATKTELVMTMNLREWKYFFDLRLFGTTGAPHPDMQKIARSLYYHFSELFPEIFDKEID